MRSAPESSQLLYFTEHGSGLPLLLVHGLMVTGEMFNPDLTRLLPDPRSSLSMATNHALIWTRTDEILKVTDEFLGT